jgi:hypothetical protein
MVLITLRRRLLLGSLLTLLPVSAAAQVTAPVWTKPDQFWFRKAVPGGHVWLNVDAQHGVKEPLFDHQRLAIELTIRTGVDYTPLTLPFADPAAQFVVKYDGSNAYIQEGAMAIEFVLGGHLWRCDLQIKWDWNRVPPTDYECLSRRPIAAGTPSMTGKAGIARRVSPDGRWGASVEDGNVVIQQSGTVSAVAIRLSGDGSADAAYEAGSLMWSPDSKSLSAYRVSSEIWRSDSLTGSVKALIARGQWTVPSSQR